MYAVIFILCTFVFFLFSVSVTHLHQFWRPCSHHSSIGVIIVWYNNMDLPPSPPKKKKKERKEKKKERKRSQHWTCKLPATPCSKKKKKKKKPFSMEIFMTDMGSSLIFHWPQQGETERPCWAVDFLKAFGKVSHSLLLHKLSHYDIMHRICDWTGNLASFKFSAIYGIVKARCNISLYATCVITEAPYIMNSGYATSLYLHCWL